MITIIKQDYQILDKLKLKYPNNRIISDVGFLESKFKKDLVLVFVDFDKFRLKELKKFQNKLLESNHIFILYNDWNSNLEFAFNLGAKIEILDKDLNVDFLIKQIENNQLKSVIKQLETSDISTKSSVVLILSNQIKNKVNRDKLFTYLKNNESIESIIIAFYRFKLLE